MKILQLVQKPQRRGAEVFAYHLSHELRSHGHTVHTLYLYPYHGGAALPLAQNAQCLYGEEHHPFERAVGIHPLLLRRLLHIIDEFQPDIVQVNGSRTVKYGALARRLRRHQSWALVYRNIGNPQDWMHSYQHRLFYKHVVMPALDGIVGVSRTTLTNLEKIYCLSIPLQHIARGVDPQALQPLCHRAQLRASLHTHENTPVLLYVGSLTPEKRIDRLLRIFHQVQRSLPEIQLWIVGDGPLRKTLEQQSNQLGLSANTKFLGLQTDVGSYIAAANLFVLTSDTEGMPGVIIEAGLLGLPAIATNVGGVAECVIDKETGVLIEPEDESGFASAIEFLLRNPQYCTQMGQVAKRWVGEHFTIAKISAYYLDFYTKVLANERII